MNSEECAIDELAKRIEQLGNTLLPKSYNSGIDEYTAEIAIRISSYRLLTHSEIEHFIELRCLGILERARVAWETFEATTRTLLSSVAYCGMQIEPDEPPKQPKAAHGTLKDHIKKAHKKYSGRVHDNHGIRIKNIYNLLLPIGINPGELDPSFLGDLDSFGHARGETAHKSFSRVRAELDPENERQKVAQIITGLRELDDLFISLDSEISAALADSKKRNE